MRPLSLEMEGFASFRERTAIDFAGADLFVLTGPTGSGKSSIIDAITFALYGLVPRYDSQQGSAPAITQGAMTARVKFDFNVGETGYAITRSIQRRASGVSASAKVSLESGDQTIASAVREANAAVEEILGLKFSEFTKCVVLPQGDFADLLHASGSERRDLLVRLLDVGLYRRVRDASAARAAGARAEVDLCDRQLNGDLADATEANLGDCRDRLARVEELCERLEGEQSRLDSLARHAREGAERAARLDGEAQTLADIHVPDGVAQLSENLGRAEQASADAREALDREQSAVREAQAELDALPQKSHLEHVVDDYSERDRLRVAISSADTEIDRVDGHRAAVEVLCDRFASQQPRLDELVRDERDLSDRAAMLTRSAEALGAVSAPQDALDLASRLAAAEQECAAATATLASARDRLADAQAAVDALPDRPRLERTIEDHRAVRALQPKLLAATADLEQARARLTEAEAQRAEAQRLRDQAQVSVDALLRSNAAYHAAHGLLAGDPCPVCGEVLARTPGIPAPHGMDEAAAERDAATGRLGDADEAVRSAGEAIATFQATVTGIENQRAELLIRLAGASSEADAQAELERMSTVAAAATAARSEESRAAETVRRTERAREGLTEARDAAWQAFHATRDSFAAQGARAIVANDLAASWDAFVVWAHAEAAACGAEAAALREQAEARAGERGDMLAAQSAACRALGIVDADAPREPRERALAARSAARERLAELRAGRGEAAKQHDLVAARLAESMSLPDAELMLERVAVAGAALTAARSAESVCAEQVKRANQALAGLAAERETAWTTFQAARDRFASEGAPAASGDLAASWNLLVEWARDRARLLAEEAAVARDGAAALATERSTLAAAQVAACEAAGIVVEDGAPKNAALVRRGQLQQELAGIVAKIARRNEVQRLRTEEADRLAIADMLTGHFQRRDTAFEGWYLAEATRQLCAIASKQLRELSSRSYSLDATDSGDFVVIDHANADATRPVKTLSGGETFLASLSLSLALAEQVAQVSPQGASHLESLFLDEGFGTLDPETLDIVRSAVHDLHASGRTVGIITHVRELAEQIPVQFRVTKDGRTSRVERVDA